METEFKEKTAANKGEIDELKEMVNKLTDK